MVELILNQMNDESNSPNCNILSNDDKQELVISSATAGSGGGGDNTVAASGSVKCPVWLLILKGGGQPLKKFDHDIGKLLTIESM